jgi:uncharacterized protein
MSNRVVHFEIPCDNPEKTLQFFKDVFGWNFQQFGDEQYWLAMTGDEKTPGINGGLMKKKDPRQPVVNTIGVDDIDSYAKKIEDAGGTIVVPKTEIPGVGYSAYFKDPDGNIHGIYQALKK